jgi:hypothetical protein
MVPFRLYEHKSLIGMVYVHRPINQFLKGGSTVNHLKRKRSFRMTAAALSLAVLMAFAFPPKLSADICSKSLIKCVIDAGITVIVGLVVGYAAGNFPGALLGVAAGGGTHFTFCLVGYDFCKRYFI